MQEIEFGFNSKSTFFGGALTFEQKISKVMAMINKFDQDMSNGNLLKVVKTKNDFFKITSNQGTFERLLEIARWMNNNNIVASAANATLYLGNDGIKNMKKLIDAVTLIKLRCNQYIFGVSIIGNFNIGENDYEILKHLQWLNDRTQGRHPKINWLTADPNNSLGKRIFKELNKLNLVLDKIKKLDTDISKWTSGWRESKNSNEKLFVVSQNARKFKDSESELQKTFPMGYFEAQNQFNRGQVSLGNLIKRVMALGSHAY